MSAPDPAGAAPLITVTAAPVAWGERAELGLVCRTHGPLDITSLVEQRDESASATWDALAQVAIEHMCQQHTWHPKAAP